MSGPPGIRPPAFSRWKLGAPSGPGEEARMRTFQLVTADGEPLGRIELGWPEWPVGSVI